MGSVYPRSFINSASAPWYTLEGQGEGRRRGHLLAGIGERIWSVCKDFHIKAVFKSDPTLRSLLSKVSDSRPTKNQAKEAICMQQYQRACTSIMVVATMYQTAGSSLLDTESMWTMPIQHIVHFLTASIHAQHG